MNPPPKHSGDPDRVVNPPADIQNTSPPTAQSPPAAAAAVHSTVDAPLQPQVASTIPPLPSPPSEGFLDKYGDKVLSAVIAGIVGFFSAITAMKADVSKLNERVVAIETRNTATEPKLEKLDQNLREMELLKQKLEILEKKDETAGMITKQLEERLKNLQIETIRELKGLLDDQVDPPG